ncbi:MAG: hypothetical protein EZS28_051986, partial [Streblomastix strix]
PSSTSDPDSSLSVQTLHQGTPSLKTQNGLPIIPEVEHPVSLAGVGDVENKKNIKNKQVNSALQTAQELLQLRLQEHSLFIKSSTQLYVVKYAQQVVGFIALSVACRPSYLRQLFDLDQLIAHDSELDEIDPTDPTTIDRTAGDGYPHADLMYFALDSLFHTRARFILREILRLSSARMVFFRTFSYGGTSLPAAVQQIFTPVPPRRQIQRPLAETDNPYYISLDDAYAKV